MPDEDGTGDEIITEYDDKTLVVNEVLFYVSYNMRRGSAGPFHKA